MSVTHAVGIDAFKILEHSYMNKSTCDILIHNGQILSMDSERRIYRPGAVAITGSRITAVGVDDELWFRVDLGILREQQVLVALESIGLLGALADDDLAV